MSKIKDVTMSFPPSPSSDVVGYKLYMEKAPTLVTHNSAFFDLGDNTTINLNDLMNDVDDVFNLGIVAVDDAGNESDFSLIDNVPLDFVPPEAPGDITITRL